MFFSVWSFAKADRKGFFSVYSQKVCFLFAYSRSLLFLQIPFHQLHCLLKNRLPAFFCPGGNFPFNQDLAGFCEKAVFDIGSANIQADVCFRAAHRIKFSMALSMSSAA